MVSRDMIDLGFAGFVVNFLHMLGISKQIRAHHSSSIIFPKLCSIADRPVSSTSSKSTLTAMFDLYPCFVFVIFL